MNAGEEPGAYLKRVADFQDKAAAAKPAEGAADVKPAEPAKPAEAKPAEVTVDPAKPVEEKKDGEGEEDEAKLAAAEALNEKGPLPPKELAAKIAASPELKAALDKDPDLKGQIFHAARLAAQVSEYKEVFPDVESAKFALTNAETFGELQEAFSSAMDVESTRPLISKLVDMSYILGEDGQPLLDEQTKQPISDGSVGRFLDNVNRMALDFYEKEAKDGKNDELLAAVQILKARMGDPAPQNEELPEQLKAERAAIDAEKARLHRQENEQLERQHNDFENRLGSSTEDEVTKLVTSLVSNTTITDFNKKAAISQIREALYEKLKNDKLFIHQRDDLMRRGYTKEVEKKRLALVVGKVKSVLGRVAAPILREAGASVIARQDATAAKVAAQVEATKTEPKGGAAAPSAPKPQTTEESIRDFRAKYASEHGGSQPSEVQVLQYVGSL